MTHKETEYLQRMYAFAAKLSRYVERHELTPEKLGVNEDHQWAVVTPLNVIGDAAAKLRNRGFDAGPNIPLGDIADMRNRLVHNYEGINWSFVEEAVFEDIPQLLVNLKQLMEERGVPLSELTESDHTSQ